MGKYTVKHTKEYIIEKLEERGLFLISDYTLYLSVSSYIDVRCQHCGNEERLKFNTILARKIGCSECLSNNKKKLVYEKLNKLNIFPLEEYKHCKIILTFKCRVCDYEWPSSFGKVIHLKGACPKCNKRARLSKEIINEKLIDKQIEFIQFTSKHRGEFKCLKSGCGHTWNAQINGVIAKNKPTGCRKCVGCLQYTNETIDKKIIEKDFSVKRIGDYVNTRTKIDWECLRCNNIFPSTPNQILSGDGCPECKHKNEKRIRDYLKNKYGNHTANKKIIYANGRRYYIDFEVNGVFIEYNGAQHYKPIKFYKGEHGFTEQQKRDEEVREYCRVNNIRLIEIPYNISHAKQYELLENL
jgi:predicted  nucleic acid-binding Zn-ribbon protein